MAREWATGEPTTSGYPFVVKSLQRAGRCRARPKCTAAQRRTSRLAIRPYRWSRPPCAHRDRSVHSSRPRSSSHALGTSQARLTLKASPQGLLESNYGSGSPGWIANGTLPRPAHWCRSISRRRPPIQPVKPTAIYGLAPARRTTAPSRRRTRWWSPRTKCARACLRLHRVGRQLVPARPRSSGQLVAQSGIGRRQGSRRVLEVTDFSAPNALIRVDADAATWGVKATQPSSMPAPM